MTKGFEKKKYNKLFVACLLSWVISIAGTLADSIIAGLVISEDAVAATGLVAPLYDVFYFFAMLLALGGCNIYSVYAGAFDKKGSYRTAGTAFLSALIIGGILVLAMIFGENLFFSFYPTTSTIETLAREYYHAVIPIALLQPIYIVIYYLVAVDGGAEINLLSNAVYAAGNAGFSLLLVNVMGVKGLAYGTLISIVLALGVSSLHFLSKRNAIKMEWCLDSKILKEICISGSTSALGCLYIAIIDIVMNKFIIVKIGSSFLAAYAVINLILNLSEATMCATDGGISFVGVSFGEKNSVALKRVANRILRNTIIISVILGGTFFCLANVMPELYGIETQEVYEAAVFSVKVLASTYIGAGIVFMWGAYFPIVGKARLGNLACFLYQCFCPLVFGLLFGILDGYRGLTWGLFLASFVTVIIIFIVIVTKYGIKKFPFIIEDNDAKIYEYELAVNEKEVITLINHVHKHFVEEGIDPILANKVEMMIEEVCMIIAKENKKKVLASCTIMIDENQIKLFTRDNGKIFDMTKIDDKINSIGAYVASRLMDTDKENTNMTTISFNRNIFVWDK